jgi:hypothetical protein
MWGMDWIDQDQVADRWRTFVNECNEPSNSIKCG